MKESGTQGNARSEVFEYGNENHLAYEDRWFGRFGDVLISSNRQTASKSPDIKNGLQWNTPGQRTTHVQQNQHFRRLSVVQI